MRAAAALGPTPHRFDSEVSPAYECVIAAAIRLEVFRGLAEIGDINS
jgi:hypothetical protein